MNPYFRMTINPLDPKGWPERLLLFVCWPLIAVVLAAAMAVVLVAAWPLCLWLHRFRE